MALNLEGATRNHRDTTCFSNTPESCKQPKVHDNVVILYLDAAFQTVIG